MSIAVTHFDTKNNLPLGVHKKWPLKKTSKFRMNNCVAASRRPILKECLRPLSF